MWRTKVDDILEYVVGRAVGVSDMFRIGGKHVVGKCRPVLVKLLTVWDRRIVLSNCYKLKNYGDRVSVAQDQPIDVRRRRVFDRLKEKDERNGGVVDNVVPLKICSYNCRVYNNSKSGYINELLCKVDMLCLQQHWLSECQLSVLGDVNHGYAVCGVSGFDNSEILRGRPYGGCAIIWRQDICAPVDSKGQSPLC